MPYPILLRPDSPVEGAILARWPQATHIEWGPVNRDGSRLVVVYFGSPQYNSYAVVARGIYRSEGSRATIQWAGS